MDLLTIASSHLSQQESSLGTNALRQSLYQLCYGLFDPSQLSAGWIQQTRSSADVEDLIPSSLSLLRFLHVFI